MRPLGKGCRHLPAEPFTSVSDQCQATVGSQSAHPPRRREPLLSSALGAVHHHTGRGGPAPLERSFYPERLTTNRSMSEKNEAGKWGRGLLLCRERPERATPPPQMTSGQRSADVWVRAFQLRKSLCRGHEVEPRRPPFGWRGVSECGQGRAAGAGQCGHRHQDFKNSNFDRETGTPMR